MSKYKTTTRTPFVTEDVGDIESHARSVSSGHSMLKPVPETMSDTDTHELFNHGFQKAHAAVKAETEELSATNTHIAESLSLYIKNLKCQEEFKQRLVQYLREAEEKRRQEEREQESQTEEDRHTIHAWLSKSPDHRSSIWQSCKSPNYRPSVWQPRKSPESTLSQRLLSGNIPDRLAMQEGNQGRVQRKVRVSGSNPRENQRLQRDPILLPRNNRRIPS